MPDKEQKEPLGWVSTSLEMIRLVQSTDWSATPLGPYETWSTSLKLAADIVLSSAFPMALRWGPDFVLLYNDGYRPILGDKHPWALGRPAHEAWSEVWPQIGPTHEAIFSGQSPGLFAEDMLLRIQRHHGEWDDGRFTLSYSPVRDDEAPNGIGGIFITAIETTDRVRAEAALRASEERYQLAIEAAQSIGTWDWDIVGDRVFANTNFAQLYSVDPERAALGAPLSDFVDGIHPEDRDRIARAVEDCVERTGQFAEEYRLLQRDGDVRWVYARGRCHYDKAGKPLRLPGATVDITERRAARDALIRQDQALREKTQALEILNKTGEMIAASLDTKTVVQAVTDAGVQLTGARFGAFFYNVTNEAGESYRLYALSGAPPEAFAKFPMPRNTGIFAPTFAGDGIVRSDDITKDPRYGRNAPHRGMPEGHLPVHSYLAVPVKSRDGVVLGGLLFGHPDVGVFGPSTEDVMAGLAAQAAIALDNSRLFEAAQGEIAERRRAEQALQELNATLEQRVSDEIGSRVQVEEALRQAQKMEAVGQLTGGIAHDFNNLLAGIMGSLELLSTRIAQGRFDDAARFVAAAQGASKRAAALTHRLLAFSRRQTLDPKAVNINRLVAGMEELIRRTVGPEIAIEVVGAVGLWTTLVDPHQLENALLNLCINARDAMPDGGRLTIETGNRWLDARAARERDLAPGQYLSLCVSDTGVGMTPEVVSRAFEPFYTTKPLGSGTGLGLSMIYGFAKQSGGQVRIYSEPGQGTMVCIYLPRHHGDEDVDIEAARPMRVARAQDGETVLVIDDEPVVRMLVTEVLADLGYKAVEAADGATGLTILETSIRVDLLITDVGLPGGMNGRQVADAGRALRPGLKVLFITGYAENAVVGHGHLEPGMQVLTKPFAMEELAARIRDLVVTV